MDWQSITLVYGTYLAVVSFLGTEFRRARPVLFSAALVFALVSWIPGRFTANAAFMVIVPSLVLLAGYRLSGLLFVRIDAYAEGSLLALDRAWLHRTGVMQAYVAGPRVIREFLETTYLLVYAAVPVGAVVLAVSGHRAALGQYWTVVLASAFLCYSVLPWLQTRPPMLIDATSPMPPMSGVRTWNQAIAGRASVRAATIPSGHAAAALATALVITQVEPMIGAYFLVLAVSIAIASVLGRYHYAIDSVLGILVAMVVWAVS